ncbi:Oxoglutarate/iron-dependent dioxygenase [Macleaya cordata]|uniref:Oxoglutarate/iron-dependent dioxygenase n=1 Tax=Macleaya cordata TaxID=56857 RepID=A0A200PZ16_MACCD|nr:Oxoglutarate/iron-dependent dioxygenase [Macleaya cordata]
MEEVEAEIMEPFEIHYSDLVLLSSSSRISSYSKEELSRLESISETIMQTLGPSGPGLLAVTGVPRGCELRRTLLPLARKLSLLNNEDRRRILNEHRLGTDVSLKNPDRTVSSFTLQLKYLQEPSLNCSFDGSIHGAENNTEEQPDVERFDEFQDNEFKNLGSTFKELGFCMMETGLQLARICDKAIGGQELEQSILESCAAKGRLIHYHSTLDNLALKEAVRRKQSTKGITSYRFKLPKEPRESELRNREEKISIEASNLDTSLNGARSCRTSLSNLWQQWHYDYGIFTVLTTPMFMSSCDPLTTEAKEQECRPPDGHIYLQIFDANKNKILVVRSPPDSFIVQVGESAAILSKGKLHSTLHSVCRPEKLKNLSRETFVVFLQPAWDKTFSISQYSRENAISESIMRLPHVAEQERHILSQEIHNIVPPLSSRLKDGMTFAEFSRQTTKQYYGGSGMQSKR